MKIVLLGKNGQLGWELQRSLTVLGELIALDRHSTNGLCGDLTDLDGLRAMVRNLKPDVVVNAAAYTNVDQAEQDAAQAERINAQAPQVLAEELKKSRGWLVHYSTDYVFDGTGNVPWREADQARPINQYGCSKLLGEEGIAASGCQHLIFRTSWVYGLHGQNFIKTMLRLGRERESLSVVNDQMGAPTSAELLADVTAQALGAAMRNPDKAGLYHLAAAGETSWYDMACFIFQHVDHAYPQHQPLGGNTPQQGSQVSRGRGFARHQTDFLKVRSVEPIASGAYSSSAKRPLNSRLNTNKLQERFSIRLPDWQDGVARLLDEIMELQACISAR